MSFLTNIGLSQEIMYHWGDVRYPLGSHVYLFIYYYAWGYHGPNEQTSVLYVVLISQTKQPSSFLWVPYIHYKKKKTQECVNFKIFSSGLVYQGSL